MKFFKKIDFLFSQHAVTAFKFLYKKLFKKNRTIKKVDGRFLLDGEDGYNLIAECIRKGDPCMICRYGSVELKAMTDTIAVRLGIRKKIRKNTLSTLCNNAGFFPNEESFGRRFGEEMQKWSLDVDILAVWSHIPMQEYAIRNYTKKARLIQPKCLEPYYFKNPWTKELKGKRVLVIHPLAETIEAQYKKRTLLFDNPDCLPEFELYTVKAVQSIGGECDQFDNWFEALAAMQEEIDKIDFDVAIIGCGAYGFALAHHIKQIGKVSIHIGGATQIMFGIKGKRWDANPLFQKMYNEHWVYPSKSDVPKAASKIEGGCYW